MVNTKSATQRLSDAQKARDLIDNGASLFDIYRAFKCTSIQKALSHVRAAFELGGRIVGNTLAGRQPLQDAPPSMVARSIIGGTRASPERPILPPVQPQQSVAQLAQGLPQSIGAGIELFRSQLQSVPIQQAQKEIDRLAGIRRDDSPLERLGKLVNLLYGFPQDFDPLGKAPSRRPNLGKRPRESVSL